MSLPRSYSIREITWSEYRKASAPLAKKIFANRVLDFFLYPHLSKSEQKKIDALGKRMASNIFRLVLAVYYKNQKLVYLSVGLKSVDFIFG